MGTHISAATVALATAFYTSHARHLIGAPAAEEVAELFGLNLGTIRTVLAHSFVLRPGERPAIIELPADLSAREA